MLRRAFALLPLAAGTLSTWLLASGASQLAGGSLAPFDPRALAVPPTPPADASAAPRATRRASWLDAGEPRAEPPERAGSPDGPCPGGARLVIAAVDPLRPARSLAVIADAGAKPMVREGGALAGRRVARITASRVYVERDGAVCWIGREPTPAASIATVASLSPRAPTLDPLAPLLDRIRRVDARTLEVDRTVRDALLERQLDLLRDVRATPERAGDRVLGLRLGQVRPGSLADRVGLRVGDRLVSINGYEFVDPEQLLEAYAKLRLAPSLTLALVRDGRPASIDLVVR